MNCEQKNRERSRRSHRRKARESGKIPQFNLFLYAEFAELDPIQRISMAVFIQALIDYLKGQETREALEDIACAYCLPESVMDYADTNMLQF